MKKLGAGGLAGLVAGDALSPSPWTFVELTLVTWTDYLDDYPNLLCRTKFFSKKPFGFSC
jgi:hypothetical protein